MAQRLFWRRLCKWVSEGEDGEYYADKYINEISDDYEIYQNKENDSNFENKNYTSRKANKVVENKEFLINNIISRLRTVVKMFKNSPSLNDSDLQPTIQKTKGNSFDMLLDSKTRWSSTVIMINKILRIREEV